ncbi:MAG: polysaccharide deacetylase family protein [Candidatus Binatia bacterium]|nr:polysaccharide deacetylase family protein [Candidatus Binatia bacterium]
MVRSRLSRSLRTVAGEAAAVARRVRPSRSGTARVLYYHRIEEETHRSCVRPSAFAEQMALLRREGYHLLPLSAVREHLDTKRPFPDRTVIVTFDDGFADNYQNAFPILQRESIPMTLFLTADFIGTDELPVLRDRSGVKPLDWAQVSEMAHHGVELGAHTLTHPNLTDLDDEALRREVTECRDRIEERTAVRVRTFCYPRGDFDDRVKDVVREAGYDLACTTMEGCVTKETHPFSLRRTFIANDDSLRDFRHKIEGSFDLLHGARAWLRNGPGQQAAV